MGAPAPYHHYLDYLSADDIHVYFISKCFIDFAPVLVTYTRLPKESTKMFVDGIYGSFGICVTGSMTVAERKRRGVVRGKN